MTLRVPAEPGSARLPLLWDRIGLLLERTFPDDDPLSVIVRGLVDAGGKRVRPLLTYLSGQAVGGHPDQLDPAAGAAELVHAASLLHDDVIDGAMSRRGMPTAWRTAGRAPALLAGDLALARSMKLLEGHTPDLRASLIAVIDEMVRAQGLEHHLCGSLSPSRAEWEAVAMGKTAALLGWCAMAGVSLAQRPDLAPSLDRFGRAFGLAFQAIDDLVDLSMPTDTGKPPLADLRARIPSLALRLASHVDPGFGDAVQSAWSNGMADLEGLGTRALLLSRAPIEAYVQGRLDEARTMLGVLPDNPDSALLRRACQRMERRLERALAA